MIVRRYRILLTLTMTALLLSGCWNRREIETLGFTLITGVDYLPDEEVYEMSVQVAKIAAFAKEAAGGEAVGKSYHVWSAKGRTVFEAVRNITRESNRKIWLSHNLVLVIGEDAARQGVRPILDLYQRDGEFRRLFWIVIAPTAKEVVLADVKAVRVPAMGLNETIKVHRATSTAQAVRLHDFLRMLSAPVSATAGQLWIAEQAMGPEFHLEGSAVFREDRLIDYLDAKETRGMLWITRRVKSGIMVVPCPGGTGEAGIEIIHADAKITPRLGRQLEFAVEITTEGHVGDEGCPPGGPPADDWNKMAKAEEKEIMDEVEAALRKARELKADVFGFGLRLYQEYPSYWKQVREDWVDQHFPEVPVRVKVQATIQRPGLIQRLPPAK